VSKNGHGRSSRIVAKQGLGILAATVLVIVLLETVLRLGAFFWNDWNQFYLFYGFHGLVGRVGISPWSVYGGGHYKFPPGYGLQGAAGQGGETAAINSLGFRGPDFDPIKPAGTFRVICLGGSSTFGFHDTDTGTYPYQLQQLFGEPINGLSVEVINGGFPYYTTASVRSLLETELASYDPDLITLYAAYNDASWPLGSGSGTRLLFWISQHSMIYLVMKETLLPDSRVLWLGRKLRRWLPASTDPAALDQTAEAVAARYRQNMEAILTFAAERGIGAMLVRQPMTTQVDNRDFNRRTYAEEYAAVTAKIAAREPLTELEQRMFLHHRLIDELDALARERNLPVVDNIAIVDQDRSRLTTWVHLTEEANEQLARALHDAIVPLIPGAVPAPTAPLVAAPAPVATAPVAAAPVAAAGAP
jgi:lysophospholipase L1-like esterase